MRGVRAPQEAPGPLVPGKLRFLQTTSTATRPSWRASLWGLRACRRSLGTIGCAMLPRVRLAPPPPPCALLPVSVCSACDSLAQAYVVLNLTADLRGEFTWNTKQLFVFVNVLFETAKNARNQMVMWSSIIEDQVQ